MANTEKTWHLAPTFDINPPPNGPLKLADLLESKFSEHVRAPLNRSERVEIPDTLKPETYGPVTTAHTVKRNNNTDGGFFAKLSQVFGGGLEANVRSSGTETVEYHFEKEHSEWFEPTKAFVTEVVERSKEADLFRRETGGKKPLFIVTGIKWVEGIIMSSAKGRGHEIGGKVEADFSATSAPVGVGVLGSRSSNVDESHTAEEAPPFVFCIRLKKITWERRGMKMKDDRDAAFLGEYKRGAVEEATLTELIIADATAMDFEEAETVTLAAAREGGEWTCVFDEG